MKKKFITATKKIGDYVSDMFIPSKYDDNSDINLKIYCLTFSFLLFPLVIIGATYYIILYTIFAED